MAHLTLTDTAGWRLADDARDIRGLRVVDADGAALGRVEALVADTATEAISTVLLDDGTGVPAVALTVADDLVTVDRRSTEAIAHSSLAPDGSSERDSPTGRGPDVGYRARVVRQADARNFG